MRILITAGAGFIGESLTRHLVAEGHFVRVLDLPGRQERLKDLSPSKIEFYGADFSTIKEDDAVFSDIETIIHLASTSAPQTSMADLGADANANILSSIRIMQGAASAGASLFLYASSGGTIYGDSPNIKLDENQPTNPISSYGVCKLAVEKYMGLYALSGRLRTIALRIANAYGPGQLLGAKVGLIAACLRKAVAGEEIEIFGDGTNTRDYIFVSDIVTAFDACLARTDLVSGVYNVGYEKGYAVREILEIVQKVSGIDPRVRYLPARGFDVKHIVLDTARFRNATGWRPKVDLYEGTSILWQKAKEQAQSNLL